MAFMDEKSFVFLYLDFFYIILKTLSIFYFYQLLYESMQITTKSNENRVKHPKHYINKNFGRKCALK